MGADADEDVLEEDGPLAGDGCVNVLAVGEVPGVSLVAVEMDVPGGDDDALIELDAAGRAAEGDAAAAIQAAGVAQDGGDAELEAVGDADFDLAPGPDGPEDAYTLDLPFGAGEGDGFTGGKLSGLGQFFVVVQGVAGPEELLQVLLGEVEVPAGDADGKLSGLALPTAPLAQEDVEEAGEPVEVQEDVGPVTTSIAVGEGVVGIEFDFPDFGPQAVEPGYDPPVLVGHGGVADAEVFVRLVGHGADLVGLPAQEGAEFEGLVFDFGGHELLGPLGDFFELGGEFCLAGFDEEGLGFDEVAVKAVELAPPGDDGMGFGDEVPAPQVGHVFGFGGAAGRDRGSRGCR
ncbi:MAG: hypothetical protein K0R22_172 [Sporomusa sp.]|nr:hypothetical protein [Sporomusa sp.]